MSPVSNAMAAAYAGLDWSRPCLMWLADYLLEATGKDFAADWRGIAWNERRALRELRRLAISGKGETLVERAMDAMAAGWEPVSECRQGAVLVGVFNKLARDGSPAIFDGQDRWILGHIGGGGVTVTGLFPDRAWEVSRA